MLPQLAATVCQNRASRLDGIGTVVVAPRQNAVVTINIAASMSPGKSRQ
ncbi:MAG: hypothetical protein LRY49_02685 [Burkholderiaceae bacterium]|nr:hypothetical protein [Burkholderiaceae bacterium]